MQARWDAADQGRGRNKRIIAGLAGMSMESGITVAMVFNLLLVLLSLFASGRTRHTQSANHSS
ncbi:hypothetical protein [uncultured Brevibacillus sp.]|uniref:hypothetical protein n=1 Tax=uncultured Brevibacillus sp. TaxID=169970 RepID=UPI0025960ECF|nr:hypothetical protein [uncultured Brevibacillus sp.]